MRRGLMLRWGCLDAEETKSHVLGAALPFRRLSPNLGANLLLVTSAKSSSPSRLCLQNCEMGVFISR